MRLTIAGAGMAGLVAGARARELGLEPVVLEKGARPGGSMLLSSGVVWRHREWDDFRAECPSGDPALQRIVHERLDDALDWLEALGAPVLERDTGNERTRGRRFDTRGLTEALGRAAGEVHLRRTPAREWDDAEHGARPPAAVARRRDGARAADVAGARRPSPG